MSSEEFIKNIFSEDLKKDTKEEHYESYVDHSNDADNMNTFLTTSEISVEDTEVHMNGTEGEQDSLNSETCSNNSQKKNLVSKKDHFKNKKRFFPFHLVNNEKENKNIFRKIENGKVLEPVDLFSTSPFKHHKEPYIKNFLKNENDLLFSSKKLKKRNEYSRGMNNCGHLEKLKVPAEDTNTWNNEKRHVPKNEKTNETVKSEKLIVNEELDISTFIETNDEEKETLHANEFLEPLHKSKSNHEIMEESYHEKSSDTNPNTDSKKNAKIKNEELICRLCLMEFSKPLQGLYPRTLFTLECGHTFHFKCLFETLKRRDCRKQCSVCYTEYSNVDKQTIFRKSKSFIKKIEKNNEALYNALLNRT